jgi:signal transduction histidine kinase
VLLARIRPYLSLVILGVSLLILVVAGVFLYQWINRLSELDRQHDQQDLVAGMVNLERGFSADLAETVTSFRPIARVHAPNSWGTFLFESYSEWRSTTRWPGLIHSISIAVRSRRGKISFETFDPATGDFEPQPWPSDLTRFQEVLQNDTFVHRFRLPFAVHGFASILADNHVVLAVPVFNLLPGGQPNALAADSEPPDQLRRARPPGPPPGVQPAGPGSLPWPRGGFLRRADFELVGWSFLELDQQYLKSRVLPALVKQYFTDAGLRRFHVAIITGDPPHIIYTSESSLKAADFSTYDARIVLFAPRIQYLFFGRDGAPRPGARRRRSRVSNPRGDESTSADVLPPPELRWQVRGSADSAAWALVARDRLGSLDVEVNAVRRRNLTIAFGTLFLLAMSIGTLVVASHRSAVLARRQMEFVAGISHELRTPLAVIESAAHNLAHGLVEDPGRVKQYGQAIQTEGRRLSSMVQQTLGYAALQSGRQRYEFTSVSVPEVLDRAWAEFAAAFEETGWTVEKEISSDIPTVEADPRVLESAVKNLLSNALKYASQGKWVRISARTVHKLIGREVVISVEDRGPGIDPGDLPHIFEPFYRGRRVIASSTAGAGLGLSLVAEHLQAHQGRVAAQNAKPKGARFLLYLPCSS